MLRIVSDLHLDTSRHLDGGYKLPDLLTDKESILVIAGDLCNGYNSIEFIKSALRRFKAVVYVLGNHEYYGHDINTLHTVINCNISEDNFYLLNRDTVSIDDYTIVGATLWTNMDNSNPITCLQSKSFMADYRHIRYGGRVITPQDTIDLHKKDIKYIKTSCEHHADKSKKLVVVTHHSPSFRSVDLKYKGSSINGAFASNLDDYIEKSRIDLWIHGHMHNHKNYNIGHTEILCNPRGYVTKYSKEESNFNNTLTKF